MKLTNHIAYRFLTDNDFAIEGLEAMYPDILRKDFEITPEIAGLYDILRKEEQKAFMVTNTVIDLLNKLHVKKEDDGHYDWKVFKKINRGKFTYIFPHNDLLRLVVRDSHMSFCYLRFDTETKQPGKDGTAHWVHFYLNQTTGELCSHFEHKDVKQIEEFLYKLLCFIYLSENEYEELQPTQKIGTRKSGKIINSLNVPLTIITSKWNVTTVRSEGFSVRGHFALRWCGQGASEKKMVFIQPYEKTGYIRRAKSELK